MPRIKLISFIVPDDGKRQKKLLLADMDNTMVVGEILDELAAQRGLKEKIAAITDRAMRGELDFQAALRTRVAMLKDLSEVALQRDTGIYRAYGRSRNAGENNAPTRSRMRTGLRRI